MTTEQKQVIQFMNLFKQQVLAKPTIPSFEVRRLRAKLIMEEALEAITALGFQLSDLDHDVAEGQAEFGLLEKITPDLNQIADGLADLHYVAYCGTAAACGIDMEPVFAEVHRSNMSKMWNEEDLKQQKTLYPTGVVEHYGHGLYRILVDGKVIKSPTYSPADIISVLSLQTSPR
jgi:predicted HAD superfamily Cof-like phosphohydrolase